MTPIMTRRQALALGFAAAAVSVYPLQGAASPAPRISDQLYVFAAEQTGKVILLATCQSGRFCSGPIETRFHIGDKVHSLHRAQGTHSVQLELAVLDWTVEPIWAERLGAGPRRRIATPFLAALIAQDPSLGSLYHASSPDTDEKHLLTPVSELIERRARQSGFEGDSRAYGKRLARAVLPDVLRFDPKRPAGFTFAARNGRHPADNESVVVNSILSGTVSAPMIPDSSYVASL
jgi:hypothetical protein